MKQVIQNLRSGILKVEEVPEPLATPGGVLVRNVASLISAGTEKMAIDLARSSLIGKARQRPDLVRQVVDKVKRDGLGSTLRTVKARLDTPLALGYSCSGIVRETGSGVEEFSSGDRVACAGMNYASHASVVAVPKNLVVRIPDQVSFEEGAFVTLGAIALQGVRTGEARVGESVAVIGLGLLGQLTVQLLKAAGCRVIGIDLDQSKIELARALGADVAALRGDAVEAVEAATQGYGADAVIVTAAAETNDPIELAGHIARDRAVVSLVGSVRLDVPRRVYYEKELQIRLSRSYGPGRYDAQYEEEGIDYPIGYVRWTERRNMAEFLRLVGSGAVKLERLISHRFAIAEAERAYAIITGSERQPHLGILLSYPEIAAGTAPRHVLELDGQRPKHSQGTVGLGVIGAGNFARSVLLPRMAKFNNASLVGLATATGRTAKSVGDQYKFGLCTTDYRELLANENITAVIIATRHDTHAEIAAEALLAGKTVFVEKPLAITEQGLDQVSAAVSQTGRRLLVGYNRRFAPLAVELKSSLRSGDARQPLAITYRINAGEVPNTSWIQGNAGGGRILGEVCHFVDFIQYLSDADPVEVFAYRAASGSDTLTIVIKLSDGSVGNINYFATGDRAFPKERIEVYGAGRVGVLDDFRRLEVWHAGKRKSSRSMSQDKGFDVELASFIEAARTGSAMPIRLGSLVLTTLTTFRIRDSIASGRPEPVVPDRGVKA